MSGLNLHAIVRGAIQTVNPDVPGDVYISTGATTAGGIRTPTFGMLPAQRLQVQAMSHEDLYHLGGLAFAGNMQKLYAYGQFAGIVRPDGKGGDLVRLGTEWWVVQHVLEWWPGWCSVSITRQVNAATLDALTKALANGAVPTLGAP
ncbi:head protein [Xanthomonas phage NEB7]|nr:head protein [Xanthomonas phage NEB7]